MTDYVRLIMGETLDLFLVAVLIAVGARGAYEDIMTGKVRNRLIVRGFLLGAIGYLALLWGGLMLSTIELSSFNKMFVNISLTWAICFIVWYCGIWSAGDAKFFMLLVFLLPLRYYGKQSPVVFLPSMILFLNAFILAVLYLAAETIFRKVMELAHFISNFHQRKKSIVGGLSSFINKAKDNKVIYARLFWGYACLFMLVRVLKIYLTKALMFVAPAFEELSFIIMIFLFRPLQSFFMKAKKMVFWLPTIVFGVYLGYNFVIFDHGGSLELSRIFRRFTGFMVFLLAIRSLVNLCVKKKDFATISTADLKPGMLLTESSIKVIKKCSKEDVRLDRLYPDGLTVQQVSLIKELSGKDPSLDKVQLCKTFPLVPFLFLGVVITIMLRGPIVDIRVVIGFIRQMMLPGR